MAAIVKTDVHRLEDTTLNEKSVFSVSAARDNESIVLYLGLHGTSQPLRLSDKDAEIVLLLMRKMVHARPFPQEK